MSFRCSIYGNINNTGAYSQSAKHPGDANGIRSPLQSSILFNSTGTGLSLRLSAVAIDSAI